MKFSLPHAASPEEAESVLASIAKFIGEPVPHRRIFRVSYTHNGQQFSVEVGKPIPAYYREQNQIVIAIFDGSPLKICLTTRAVVRGDPILVGATSVSCIEYFES